MSDTLNFEHLSREEIENQLWIHKQIVDFNNILYQNIHQSRELFAELIIHQLAKLTQALRGSFFIADDSHTELKAIAAYACALENLPKTVFNFGEGLIGQTAKTKEKMYLEDLPKDNIFIESSLGRISVKSLSIVPLVADNKVLGVVELLFLNNLDKKHQDLLYEIAQTIGTVLYGLQNNNSNTETIAETIVHPQVSEELQQKLESLEKESLDLKTKNEDLLNLNDSIKVQNTNLSNQLEDSNQQNQQVIEENKDLKEQLEKSSVFQKEDLANLHLSDETLMILDLDFEGFITRASKRFLEVTQLEEDAILGKTYDVTHHPQTPVPLFEYVRQEAIREENFQNCYRVARQDGANYWVKFQMIPVWDATQQHQNFRLFFYEVTEELEKLSEVKQELRNLLEKKFELEQLVGDFKMQLAEAKAQAAEASPEDKEQLETLQKEVSDLQDKLSAQVEIEYELREKLLSQMKVVEEVDTLRLKNNQLEEREANQTQLNEELENLRLQHAQLEEQLATQSQNSADLEELQSKNSQLEEQLKGFNQANQELETLRSKNAELQNQLATQSPTEISSVNLEELHAKNLQLEEQLKEQKQAHQQEVEVRLAQYAENLDSYLLTQKAQLEQELEELKQKLSEAPIATNNGIDRDVEALTRELGENQSRLQELEDARQALIARESLLNQVALVSETGLDGIITYVNEKFCEVSQYPQEDLLGHPHSVIRHPDTPPEIFREMWDVIKQGKIFKGRFKNLRKDGSSFWVESNISPVLDESGNIIKYISIQLDITEEMQRKLGVFQEKNIFSE